MLLIVALAASVIAPMATIRAQTSEPLFSVTIIAPGNANLLRRQWSQVFASNLQELGIDAKVVYLGWTPVYDRVFTPSLEMVGKTYDEGGFDIQAVGWTPGLLPEPRQNWYGSDAFFAPNGQNYQLWNNAESNTLLDQFITSTDDNEKTSALKQWQQIYFEEVPASQIHYEAQPAVVNPALGNLYTPATGGGEAWLYFNAQPYPQLITRSDGKNSLVYCSTGEIDSLLPPTSNSWYDTIVWMPIYSGLAEAWPTLSGLSDLQVPSLLASWSHSADGFTWTFNCRQGVTWHDGEAFTADDVVFSLWALMNPEPPSQFVGYYTSVYGDNVEFTYSDGTSTTLGTGNRVGSVTATDQYTVVAELPELALGKPYGYFEPYLIAFTNNIIPKHIFENIPLADWTSTPFSTGQGSISINGKTYTGPLGTGPYKWVDYDVAAQVIHLERFDSYWNATALKNDGLFQIEDYYIRFIADKTSALAALKNGEVDMLGQEYQMSADVPTIDPSWGRVLKHPGTGRQEFGYNMRHPIFGTGVDTPLGKSTPSRAAEAARYIRQAFDYAIPRELIINNLLAGDGLPGITPLAPTQPFYDDSLTARPYDLEKAKQLLTQAGYSPPETNLGSVVNLQGILSDENGEPKADTLVKLFVTTDNATYPSSLQYVAEYTTDEQGFWRFTVAPENPGTYYYYLQDTSTSEYQYLQSHTVAAGIDLLLIAAIVAVVVIVIIVVVVIFVRRRK